MAFLLGLVAVVACLALFVLTTVRVAGLRRDLNRMRHKVHVRDRLIHQLRELANQQRELEPGSPLAVMVVDEITMFLNRKENA